MHLLMLTPDALVLADSDALVDADQMRLCLRTLTHLLMLTSDAFVDADSEALVLRTQSNC